MLQSFQTTDHGFDAATYQFILMNETGARTGQGLLTLAQRPILLTQESHCTNQIVDAFLETFEFGLERLLGCFCHSENYRVHPSGGSIENRPVRHN